MHVTPPANGLNNPISVNGRLYSVVAGQALTVPDQDGMIMVANGWVSVPVLGCVQITAAQYAALANPDPNTLYAIVG